MSCYDATVCATGDTLRAPRPQVFTGAVIVSPLLVSIIWCLYNALPPILLFTYAIAGRKYILSFMCGLAMIVSTAAVIASLGFIWWIQVRHTCPKRCTATPSSRSSAGVP
jgi:hypothetical protein